MQSPLVEEMKRSIGFGAPDVANVRALAPHVEPCIAPTVDRFYDRLLQTKGAAAVLNGRPEQIKRLRDTLLIWLRELFYGDYGPTYFQKRLRIGSAHVRVGLPQHYMFTGMELIWQELSLRLRAADIPEVSAKLDSLHKLLMFDLAVMLESYKDSYAEDIRRSERTTMEEKLTRAEHLAQIGQLAASLAHEIKNPLAGISGAIQVIRGGMPAQHAHRPILTEILGQIGRLDATVKDLLQYARPTPPKQTKVALGAVVKRVLTVLRREPAFEKVGISYDRPPVEPVIDADDGQLEQLLMNLLINAAHASQGGGVVQLGLMQNRKSVKLIVRDHGKGMPPDVRERAFEPFYTTKTRGTGLGLSICRRIVEAHDGRIEIDSAPNEGTTVTVTLPQAEPAETEAPTS
ncbi:MAG: protoglobin domain-containing protein [Phycisphaerae bacterium]